MSVIISIDPGINGCIARFENGYLDDLQDIPTKTVVIKPARYKYKHKDPKIVIKSGENAGSRPKVIVTPAKTRRVIDFSRLTELLHDREYLGDGCPVVMEKTAFMRQNAGSLTKLENNGILKGILIARGVEPKEVQALTWKKALGVTSDKETSMRLAAQLFEGWEFSRDDQAEAALIGKWYLQALAG